jgi:dolichol-phosphate mannosyltransferase
MRTLVIVPTYNERPNVPVLARQLLALSPEIDLCFVDDNSPDGTGAVLDRLAAGEPRVHVLHRPGKLGLGTAYLAGFRFGLARSYDAFVQMDADLSHDPEAVPELLAALGDADVAVGSRYIGGVRVLDWPMRRLLLSFAANVYATRVTGLRIRDATGGFNAYRRRVLEALELARVRSDGYVFLIELKTMARDAGFRLREVPIVFRGRHSGTSKISRRIVLEALVRVWAFRMRRWFRRGCR